MTQTTPTSITELGWPERLQVIKTLGVSKQQAQKVFGVSSKQLKEATEANTADEAFDAAPYESDFVIKKRGRQGSNIEQAFAMVTTTPQPLVEFAIENNVSVAVMKQHSRFVTKVPTGRQINTRQHEGVACIWYTPISDTTED